MFVFCSISAYLLLSDSCSLRITSYCILCVVCVCVCVIIWLSLIVLIPTNHVIGACTRFQNESTNKIKESELKQKKIKQQKKTNTVIE